MDQEQNVGQDSAALVYAPKELAELLGRSLGWIYDHAPKLPGARETFPGSGKWVFLKTEADAYYGW
jgi:hypothetical protein